MKKFFIITIMVMMLIVVAGCGSNESKYINEYEKTVKLTKKYVSDMEDLDDYDKIEAKTEKYLSEIEKISDKIDELEDKDLDFSSKQERRIEKLQEEYMELISEAYDY